MAEHCRSCGQALPPEKQPTELRAWFMYDCHLFKRIDTSDRAAVFPQVREVFDEDGSGIVFVRAQPGEKTREDLTLQADWCNNGGKYVMTDDEIVAWIKRFYAAAEAPAPGVRVSPHETFPSDSPSPPPPPPQAMTEPTTPPKSKRPQGFAAMDPQLVREIASLGGRTAHEQGRANTWNSQTAREAAMRSAEVRRAKRSARVQAMSRPAEAPVPTAQPSTQPQPKDLT